MKFSIGFLTSILILSFAMVGCVKTSRTSNNSDDPWRSVVNIAEKAIVKVLVFETNPVTDELELMGHGSGTVISSDGFIVTAAHVLDMEEDLYKPVFKVEFLDKSIYDVTLVKFSQAHDVGIVKIDLKTRDIKIPFCSEKAKIAEPLLAAGHAYPFVLWFSDGVVSAYQVFDGDMGRGDAGAEWMLMTSPVNPGVSGGPLFTRAGCIAGIVSAMSLQHNEVYFAVPGPSAEKEVNKLIHEN